MKRIVLPAVIGLIAAFSIACGGEEEPEVVVIPVPEEAAPAVEKTPTPPEKPEKAAEAEEEAEEEAPVKIDATALPTKKQPASLGGAGGGTAGAKKSSSGSATSSGTSGSKKTSSGSSSSSGGSAGTAGKKK
ncbi:MAG: hypothetical protein GY913_11280 [Proteobacteria bacterium]|nr:hypothetical protein [Pseudomonadota bacterium]